MAKNEPTLAEWRQLYEIWGRFKEIAPWEWMNETNVFGIQDPQTGQLGFVSVMGALGEHYAIALYLGSEGLYGFWAMQQAGPTISPELFFQIPQLQASFEDREMLHERDRTLIKQLGLKFRGRQVWPIFRSYRPGFAPWFLEAEEVRFLTHVLEQAQDVMLRFRNNWTILPTRQQCYLTRVARKDKDNLVWEDQHLTVPPPEPVSIRLRMDMQALAALKSYSRSKFTLEMDLFMLPSSIRDAGDRPYYPYTLLTVDKQSGMIIGHDLLQPIPSLLEMYSQIPTYVVHQLIRFGSQPKEIRIRSPLLNQLLPSLEEDLDFKLKLVDRLPKLDSARNELFRFMLR